MRFCIQSLMKLEEVEGADYLQFRTIEDDDMDEEDHEALCNLFTTVSTPSFFNRHLAHSHISTRAYVSLLYRLERQSTIPRLSPT